MMNGKVRAFNGDMGMAMSVFKDMVGKVRFVFADPPYKITQARYGDHIHDRRSTANRVFAILGKNLIVNIFDKTIITSKNPNGLTFIRVYQRPNII